jgi:serine O-acetyltransferase
MFQTIRDQFDAVFRQDPAARSRLEILLCYPGVHAMLMHRAAHWLYRRRLYVIARLVSHFSRWITGIEIHPGAQIGRRFFIDHGMGVVIGETAVIGDDVLLYQGVTLGGTGHEKAKRHPTLCNHVVVGSGAKVLGDITIGEWVRVGAGSVVVKPVEAHSTVVGIPGRVVAVRGIAVQQEQQEVLEHGHMPDPVGNMIAALTERITRLEAELHETKGRPADPLARISSG